MAKETMKVKFLADTVCAGERVVKGQVSIVPKEDATLLLSLKRAEKSDAKVGKPSASKDAESGS